MGVTARIAPAITITGTTLLVSCGGYGGSCGSYGSYGSYGSCGPLFPGPNGIYEGALNGATSVASQTVVAIIAEDGGGRIGTADGHYYRLNVTASGNSLGGSFSSYSQAGASPAGGAPSSTGSLAGQMTSTGLNLTLTDAMNSTQSMTLTFDDVYKRGSALPDLAGAWTSITNGLTLTATVQSDGSFSALDSNNCSYSGSFSVISPAFDVYAETHVRSCNGVATTFNGLAALLPTNDPSAPSMQLKLLTDNDAGEYLIANFQ